MDNNIKSPLEAIKAKCLDCVCGQQSEVELCTITECALHPFRFGKNPYRKKNTLTQEQKEAATKRLLNSKEC